MWQVLSSGKRINTGLLDGNNKPVFDGDILYKEGHWTFYVGYEMGAFRAIPLEPVQKLNWPHCTLEEFLRVGMGDCKGFKVIGNIHDTVVQDKIGIRIAQVPVLLDLLCDVMSDCELSDGMRSEIGKVLHTYEWRGF